jgi:hypothetical protein
MTVIIYRGEVRITCNACGVPVLGLIHCSCGYNEREWCEEHVCTCCDLTNCRCYERLADA